MEIVLLWGWLWALRFWVSVLWSRIYALVILSDFSPVFFTSFYIPSSSSTHVDVLGTHHPFLFVCFGHRNLNFLARDWTCAFCQWKRRVLSTGLPGNFWETHPFKKKDVVGKKKKREGCGGWQFGSWNIKKDHTIRSGDWFYFWTRFTRGIMLPSSEENLERLEEEAITSPPLPWSPISWHDTKTQSMI